MTQFFVLDLDGWFGVLSNKLIIFDIPLLYYCIILQWSKDLCLISGDMCLSFGVSLSSVSLFSISFVTDFKIFCGNVYENFVILSGVWLPVKSPVASVVLWIIFLK